MAQDFILLYAEPGTSTFALVPSSGTGCVFDGDPADLINGTPADQTPFTWPTVTQTTSINVALQRVWTSGAIVPKSIALLGLGSIPAGTKVTVTGQRVTDGATFPYALGGNSVAARTQLMQDGSIGLVIVCDDGLTAIRGIQVQIFNACNATGSDVTCFTSGQFVYIGGCTVYMGWSPPDGIEYDWDFQFLGLAAPEPASTNQVRNNPARPYLSCKVTLTAEDFATSWGSASSPAAVTYMSMAWLLARGGQCGAIVRHLDSSGNLDLWKTHNLSVFGTATAQPPKPLGGDHFNWEATFTQSAPGN